VIAVLAGQGYRPKRCCRILGVAPAGYFVWKRGPVSQAELRRQWLRQASRRAAVGPATQGSLGSAVVEGAGLSASGARWGGRRSRARPALRRRSSDNPGPTSGPPGASWGFLRDAASTPRDDHHHGAVTSLTRGDHHLWTDRQPRPAIHRPGFWSLPPAGADGRPGGCEGWALWDG
jgi:hypothetical protein